MVDFKAYIFSLVAVFLALGIGIVVGITLVSDDSLAKEQKIIIDRLEDEFTTLREVSRQTQKEISSFKDINGVYVQFAETVLPELVKEKLRGRNIAVISINQYVNTDILENTLILAGANVASLIRINTNFDFTSANFRTVLQTDLGIKTKETNELIAETSRLIASGITDGFEQREFALLQEMNLVQFIGSAGVTLDNVILIGGRQVRNDNLVKLIDLTLIDYFTENGVKVAAAEQSQVPYSSMPLYQTKDIITVDNIETVIGQVALIYALDEMPGHYGVKATAASILPDPKCIKVGNSF